MNPRKVVVTMEGETDAPLKELHIKNFKDNRKLIAKNGTYNLKVLQIQANVVKGKK